MAESPGKIMTNDFTKSAVDFLSAPDLNPRPAADLGSEQRISWTCSGRVRSRLDGSELGVRVSPRWCREDPAASA
jgi:hypothetical protein